MASPDTPPTAPPSPQLVRRTVDASVAADVSWLREQLTNSQWIERVGYEEEHFPSREAFRTHARCWDHAKHKYYIDSDMCMHPVAERVYDERFASTHNQLLDCTKNVQFGDEITYGVVSSCYEEDNPDGTHIGDSIHMRVKTLDECRCSADGTLQSIRWTGPRKDFEWSVWAGNEGVPELKLWVRQAEPAEQTAKRMLLDDTVKIAAKLDFAPCRKRHMCSVQCYPSLNGPVIRLLKQKIKLLERGAIAPQIAAVAKERDAIAEERDLLQLCVDAGCSPDAFQDAASNFGITGADLEPPSAMAVFTRRGEDDIRAHASVVGKLGGVLGRHLSGDGGFSGAAPIATDGPPWGGVEWRAVRVIVGVAYLGANHKHVHDAVAALDPPSVWRLRDLLQYLAPTDGSVPEAPELRKLSKHLSKTLRRLSSELDDE